MGLRESINAKPRLSVTLAASIAIVALAYTVWNVLGSASDGLSGEVYYTIDDGKTWFADAADKVPPFEIDGKPAVRARVYRCPEGQAFVGYMEKFSQEGKAALDGLRQRNEMANSGAVAAIYESEILVKKPGDAAWHGPRTPEGSKAVIVGCENSTIPEVIEP
jgi:hypothetical protein